MSAGTSAATWPWMADYQLLHEREMMNVNDKAMATGAIVALTAKQRLARIAALIERSDVACRLLTQRETSEIYALAKGAK